MLSCLLVSVTVPIPTPTPVSISLLNDLSIIEFVNCKLGDMDEEDDKDDDVIDEDNEAGVNESDKTKLPILGDYY